jgi:hypothetical protein
MICVIIHEWLLQEVTDSISRGLRSWRIWWLKWYWKAVKIPQKQVPKSSLITHNPFISLNTGTPKFQVHLHPGTTGWISQQFKVNPWCLAPQKQI